MSERAPAEAIALRVATALGWKRLPLKSTRYCDTRDSEAGMLSVVNDAVIHLVRGDIRLRLAWQYDRFSASLVFYPPNNPPRLTPGDVAILKTVDNATDGMVTFGARNAGDATLLAWLASEHASAAVG